MSGVFWADTVRVPDLEEREKVLRDQFIREYLVDYNEFAAVVRMGFAADFAKNYADMFMREPYVRQKLSEAEKGFFKDGKLNDEKLIGVVVAALYKEALQGDNSRARVMAQKTLLEMLGVEAKKPEEKEKYLGHVMKVPGIASIDEWEKAAQQVMNGTRH